MFVTYMQLNNNLWLTLWQVNLGSPFVKNSSFSHFVQKIKVKIKYYLDKKKIAWDVISDKFYSNQKGPVIQTINLLEKMVIEVFTLPL